MSIYPLHFVIPLSEIKKPCLFRHGFIHLFIPQHFECCTDIAFHPMGKFAFFHFFFCKPHIGFMFGAQEHFPFCPATGICKNTKVNMVLDGIKQRQRRADLYLQLCFLHDFSEQPFIRLFKEMQTTAWQIPLLMTIHEAAFHFVFGTTKHQRSILFNNDSFYSHRKIPFHRIASFCFLLCFFQQRHQLFFIKIIFFFTRHDKFFRTFRIILTVWNKLILKIF